MISAFQPNAFQPNAFQIGVAAAKPAVGFNLGQLDQGIQFQSVLSYHGPTLGWVRSYVKPERLVKTTGTTPKTAFQIGAFQGVAFQDTTSQMGSITVGSGDSIILIDTATSVTVLLPDVEAWILQPVYQPYDPIDRAIWIKDIGSNAAAFPITIAPFGDQTIDGQSTASIPANFGILRLSPLYDFSGWFIDGP